MCCPVPQLLPALQVPVSNRPILAAGEEITAVWRDRKPLDGAAMAIQGPRRLARPRIPRPDHAIVAAREGQLAARVPGHAPDGPSMAGELDRLRLPGAGARPRRDRHRGRGPTGRGKTERRAA